MIMCLYLIYLIYHTLNCKIFSHSTEVSLTSMYFLTLVLIQVTVRGVNLTDVTLCS